MSSKLSSPKGLSKLLDSKKYSDLKLVCHGQEFKVHKAIVCTISPVLDAAASGDFEEGQTSVININEFDAETVERMLAYMYSEPHDYNAKEEDENEEAENKIETENADLVKQEEDEDSGPPLSTVAPPISTSTELLLRHAKVNAIADYYDISRLIALANLKIQIIFETSWSTNAFLELASEVLSSNEDKALHKILASYAATHIGELNEMEKFADLRTAINFPAFALEVLQNTVAAQKAREESHVAYKALASQELKKAKSEIESLDQSYTMEKTIRNAESDRADRVIKNIDDCRQVLARTRSCRNVRCEESFSCNIEKAGEEEEPRYTLRCARCKCRHRVTD